MGTEDDWDQPVAEGPDGRPERIRAWLAALDEEQDLGYALLIGDPDPQGAEGDILKKWMYGVR